MQASLDAEVRGKADGLKLKKKLEADINELELQVDLLTKNNAELSKNSKKMQQQIKVFLFDFFFLLVCFSKALSHIVTAPCPRSCRLSWRRRYGVMMSAGRSRQPWSDAAPCWSARGRRLVLPWRTQRGPVRPWRLSSRRPTTNTATSTTR